MGVGGDRRVGPLVVVGGGWWWLAGGGGPNVGCRILEMLISSVAIFSILK